MLLHLQVLRGILFFADLKLLEVGDDLLKTGLNLLKLTCDESFLLLRVLSKVADDLLRVFRLIHFTDGGLRVCESHLETFHEVVLECSHVQALPSSDFILTRRLGLLRVVPSRRLG